MVIPQILHEYAEEATGRLSSKKLSHREDKNRLVE